MTDYNFWQNFFDTYQSLSDLLKVLWLIVPPAFMLGLVALTLRFRIDSKRAGLDGELVYSVHRDKQSRVHIISHVKQAGDNPPLLFLDQEPSEPFEYAEGKSPLKR